MRTDTDLHAFHNNLRLEQPITLDLRRDPRDIHSESGLEVLVSNSNHSCWYGYLPLVLVEV
jgi:hypothetical protein